jgi:energy-coupling factor transporter ATP-binding protein EcfA2
MAEVKMTLLPRCFIVIGKTGSGKSTFIKMWSKLSRGNNLSLGSNSIDSETKECQNYSLSGFKIIDTPGFADTKQSNQEIENNILNHVFHEDMMTGIIIINNFTECRLTKEELLIMKRIKIFFTKDFMNRVFIVNTYCSARSDGDFKVTLDKYKDFKLMINCIVGFDNLPEDNPHYDPDHIILQMNKMIENMSRLNKLSSNPLIRVFELRTTLLEYLEQLNMLLENNNRLSNLRKRKKIYKKTLSDSLDSLFIEEGLTELIDMVTIRVTDDHNTNCVNCVKSCHENCKLTFLSHGSPDFKGCNAFSNDSRHKFCDCGCSVEFHYHSSYTFINERMTPQEAQIHLENIKLKLMDEQKAVNNVIEVLNIELKDIESSKEEVELLIEKVNLEVSRMYSFEIEFGNT